MVLGDRAESWRTMRELLQLSRQDRRMPLTMEVKVKMRKNQVDQERFQRWSRYHLLVDLIRGGRDKGNRGDS